MLQQVEQRALVFDVLDLCDVFWRAVHRGSPIEQGAGGASLSFYDIAGDGCLKPVTWFQSNARALSNYTFEQMHRGVDIVDRYAASVCADAVKAAALYPKVLCLLARPGVAGAWADGPFAGGKANIWVSSCRNDESKKGLNAAKMRGDADGTNEADVITRIVTTPSEWPTRTFYAAWIESLSAPKPKADGGSHSRRQKRRALGLFSAILACSVGENVEEDTSTLATTAAQLPGESDELQRRMERVRAVAGVPESICQTIRASLGASDDTSRALRVVAQIKDGLDFEPRAMVMLALGALNRDGSPEEEEE